MPTPTFDDMVIRRIQLMDYNMNENIIINHLKIMLYNSGMNINEINDYLYLFYATLDINLDYEYIVNINVLPLIEETDANIMDNIGVIFFTNIMNHDTNQEEPHDTNQDTNDTIYQDINNTIYDTNIIASNIINIINIFTNTINNPPPMEDVVVTTDISKLNTITIKDDIEDKCTICLLDIDIGNEIFDITCKHYFHKNCLAKYLESYNHICPICRSDIGTSMVNLT